MSNFNYYLNRSGSRGRQGVKGDKGEAGYSPYIDIKSNTPTEFIMTIHNETESFDTPNLIPTAIGEKVTEMDAVLTTHTEDIANLKLEDQNINTNITSLQGDLTNLSGEVNTLSGEVASNSADITAIKSKNNTQDSDIAALKTRVGGTEESIEDLNHKYTVLGSEVSDLTLTKQNRLVEGANITLTDNSDGTTTISSTGGGGGSSSPLDSYIEGSTTENVTTISAKNGKALELSAPTIAVGDNLVNEINGTNTQLYLKQGDIAAGNNITVEKTATGVKISSTGGTSTDVPIATTQVAGKVKPDGTTITITDDGTISAVGGGGGTPANMVTTDTTQTITGFKTFTNNLHVNAPIASNGMSITCSNNSVVDQGLTIINEDMTGKKFSISVNDAGQANISGTTLNIGDVSLNTYVSGRNINMTTGDTGNLVVNTNNPIKVHNKTANTDDIVLVQGNIKAGDNVSLTKDTATGDITISSTGGGGSSEPPANMVTTDTQQVITASKTISAHDGHSSSVKGGALTFENQDGASGYCAISIRKGSGDAIGYTPICQLSSDSFTITQSEQAFNGYAQNSIQLTLQNAVPELVLGSPRGSSRISHDDKGLNIINSSGNCGIFVPMNGGDYKNQAGFLNIGSNSLRYYKDSTNYVDLLAGSSAPANMVTTDTDQFITGTKSFYGSINLKGSETDNYYSMITNTGGSIKLQAQYGNPAGLNVGVSSLTYTDASGIDHNLLSSGAAIDDSAASDTSTYSSSKIEKLTNITSSDTSITVTKSDAGVDIVANKALVTGYTFPSDRYVDLTLGASGSKYTMPADGYLYISGDTSKANGRFEISTGQIGAKIVNPISNNSIKCFVPVAKNNEVTVFYPDVTVKLFRFVYVEGSQPAA